MNDVLVKRKLVMLFNLKKIKKQQLKKLHDEKRYWYRKKNSSYMKNDVSKKIKNCNKVLESINFKINDCYFNITMLTYETGCNF